MEMGADDYITKPFEDIELLNAVEIRLKRAAVLDHKYSSSPSGISQFLKDVKDAGLVKQLADQYEVLTLNKKQACIRKENAPGFYIISLGEK